MFIETVKYEITMGVLEGYDLNNIDTNVFMLIIDMALEKWKEYALELSKGIEINDNKIIVKEEKASIKLVINNLYNEEV